MGPHEQLHPTSARPDAGPSMGDTRLPPGAPAAGPSRGHPRVRTSTIAVVLSALCGALSARLWYLQVAAADQFHAAANKNAVREIREPAIRGRILDAAGNVLVD